MKLHYTQGSPFARKVLVVAHELGLADGIELMSRPVTPIQSDPALNADNPLGKLPALALDEGGSLYDSPVICAYLDAKGGGRLIPPVSDAAHWRVRRQEALADGLMDAAVLARYEGAVRPEDKRWPQWVEGQKEKVARALDAMAGEAGELGERVDLGAIAFACACGYLDFRFPDIAWRDGRPQLASWYERFAARPSMRATVPPAG